MTINQLHGRGHMLDAPTVMKELMQSAKKVSNGNVTEIEQMLMVQAKTLDYVFYDALTKLVDLSMINQIECFMNIALRAQTQSRKTLATLAELKHPRRTTFIQQQNNAGIQQVNNSVKLESKEVENNKKIANELLSEGNHATLDFRGTSETIGVNQAMEALEPVKRRKNNRREKR